MTNTKYNGWANRETWLINVWFNPESKSDVEMAREQLEYDLEKLPAYLSDFIDEGAIDWDELLEIFDDEEEIEE